MLPYEMNFVSIITSAKDAMFYPSFVCLSVCPSVCLLGVLLVEQMKVLGVVLDQRLTFEKHATAVAKSFNYHAQAIRHI